MSKVMEALSELGFSGALYGADPTNEKNYLSRIKLDQAAIPKWGIVQKKLLQLENLQKADLVRQEAKKHMMQILNARDEKHLDIIISNNSRFLIRLLHKGKKNWSLKERKKYEEINAKDIAIENIIAISNRLETELPKDFSNNKYWKK